MGRQRAAVRVNQFAGGFNTEANPLNFPEGASFDEQNCDLLRDGSRRRRNGFNTDFGTPVNTLSPTPDGIVGRSQFVWSNPGGFTGVEFLVVQIGDYIGVHSLTTTPITNNRIYNRKITGADETLPFGFANVDGVLHIATGSSVISRISYDGEDFTYTTGRLLIRDMFGVDSPGLTEPENVQKRSASLPHSHLYNLRNQTFARPRVLDDDNPGAFVIDPLTAFRLESGLYPSNADNVNFYLVANPEIDANRTVERFNPNSMERNPPPNTRAPMGFFIIDALNRGSSRKAAYNRLLNQHPALTTTPPSTIPVDRTPGGPTTMSQYAGRVWYGGFSGDVISGDNRSPRLSSYLLFSQVVQEPSQTFWCFQQADPTDGADPDLVDSDGGFIKIDGAYGIKHLIPVDSSLFVFAENGVWRVVGGDENSFTATSFVVDKITDKGCVSGQSVIFVDGTLLYWSDSAIYSISKDSVGVWTSQSITDETIKTFYQAIPTVEKISVTGYYDDVTGTIRWLYGGDLLTRVSVKELVLNRKFQVFTRNRVDLPSVIRGPITVSGGKLSNSVEQTVTVEGGAVTVSGNLVTSPDLNPVLSASQNFYCIVTQVAPTIRYVFGGYSSTTPYDWGIVDTPAYLTTGFLTGGDARLKKDVPYITTHFNRLPDFSGSCIIKAQWDWTSSALSNQWSQPRQAYRVTNIRSGETTVTTRNRIRGIGRSVAFNLSSEPGEFFHLFGWEHNLEATTDE